MQVTVNYLTGSGIDETLSRKDSSGTYSYLTDNLSSTLALTSSTGAITTSYGYGPYGNVSRSGAASANTIQYAGRENDGTGLYYYRARYYSPTYGRFISEDPIGMLGGINLYGYVGGNPIYFSDPLGLADWSQFQLPGGLSSQDLQSLGVEQSVQAQLQAAQLQATQIEYQAAQCLAEKIVSNYHSVFPLQDQIGPIEAFRESVPLGVAHGGLEITVATGAHVYEKGAAMGGPEAEMLEMRAKEFSYGKLFLEFGMVEDAADIVADTYVTVTTSSCCSIR